MKKRAGKLVIVIILLFTCKAAAVSAQDTIDKRTVAEYLHNIMDFIQKEYSESVSDNDLVKSALEGMFNRLDSYTGFYDREEAEEFFSDISGVYGGIGVVISKIGDAFIVIDFSPDSPARAAGMQPGDRIVAVDGISTAGLSVDEVTEMIKGQKGEFVTLRFVREREAGLQTVSIERREIKVNPLKYEIAGKIGFIRIEKFSQNIEEFFLEALGDMDQQGIRKIILDLRDNPGGDVKAAVAVAEHFVPQGIITKLVFNSPERKDLVYYSETASPKYQLAVLVNSRSASASEIVAGAVQDTGAGIIIGSRTYGKSKVQSLVPLLTPEAFEKYRLQLGLGFIDAYELREGPQIEPQDEEIIGWAKITNGEYYTPKGRVIDQAGIIPDVAVDDYELVRGEDIRFIDKLTKRVKPGLNSYGLDVLNAEKILKVRGYEVDSPDPLLDEKTFQAIMKFQHDHGLYPYGVLDFATQQALNKELDKIIAEVDIQYLKALEILNQEPVLLR